MINLKHDLLLYHNTPIVVLLMPCWEYRVVPYDMFVPLDAGTHRNLSIHIHPGVMYTKKHKEQIQFSNNLWPLTFVLSFDNTSDQVKSMVIWRFWIHNATRKTN